MFRPLISGLAGACALTLTHELTRKFVPNAPRLDIAGMRALAMGARVLGLQPPTNLHQAAFAGDILSNATYYSMAGLAGKNALPAGALLGLAAGVCSVTMPGYIGVGDGPTARTTETKALTILYYAFGGLVAGAAYRAMARD